MKTEGRAPRSDPPQDEEISLVERPSVADYALLEELRFVRREAQAEANQAYQDWGTLPCGERYAVYRAAQDRADAAQDQLANWASEIGRELTDGPLALEALT
jgi:acyl-CoA reductase-like NAD-dependent aldehyde dehydrogenase